MALIGDCKTFSSYESDTETQTITVSYPENIPEGSEVYEKRGTEEEVVVPLLIEEETLHTNVYVIVHSINSWKSFNGSEKITLMNICYRAYDSKESRESNYDSYIFEDHLIGQSMYYTDNISEIEHAYKLVNTTKGLDLLVNDN